MLDARARVQLRTVEIALLFDFYRELSLLKPYDNFDILKPFMLVV